MSDDEYPRPRFAWGAVPVTVMAAFALAILLSVMQQVRRVITTQDLPAPSEYVALEGGPARVGQLGPSMKGLSVLGIWRHPGHPSELMMVVGAEAWLPTMNESYFRGFKDGLKETGNLMHVVVNRSELERRAGRTVAFVDLTGTVGSSQMRLRMRVAAFALGNSILQLFAYAPATEESAGQAAFEGYLTQLFALSPRMRPIDTRRVGYAGGQGIGWGGLLSLPIAFAVTRRRRNAYEQAMSVRERGFRVAQPPPPPERIDKSG